MIHLALREGQQQPRPLLQLQSLLADGQLQQTLASSGAVELDCGPWLIGLQELAAMQQALAAAGLALQRLVSAEPQTRVAAAALAIAWEAPTGPSAARDDADPVPLQIHQGTLRSGDRLESEGSLLVLGDVNPGAQLLAAGHVLVWGTLRGVAHAGNQGDRKARIVALQLRPLQLRIADCVARGPEDLPVPGFAEQAEIVDGVIAINPAAPQWPLSG